MLVESWWDIIFGSRPAAKAFSFPKDATVVDYTWQYVNKSGGPDKRFQNNKKIPVCLYGEMEISGAGVNTDLMFSNPNIER